VCFCQSGFTQSLPAFDTRDDVAVSRTAFEDVLRRFGTMELVLQRQLEIMERQQAVLERLERQHSARRLCCNVM
jgi:hypothetical protein